MLAVGPPRSEITPVKPGTVSRIVSISRIDRVLGAVLDDAALVLGDRAERAAAEAAALDRDREADHLVGGDLRVAVGRVRHALVRQLVDRIHLLRGERDRRRVEPHVHVAVALHQRARVARDSTPGGGCARRARRAPGRPRPARTTAGGSRCARGPRAAAGGGGIAGPLRLGCGGDVTAFRIDPGGRRESVPGGSGRGVHAAHGLPDRSGSRAAAASAAAGFATPLPLLASRTDRPADSAAPACRRGRVDLGPAVGRGPARERGAAQVGDLVDGLAAPRGGARSRRSAARRCRTPAGRPSRPSAPSGAPSPTSSRSARCA